MSGAEIELPKQPPVLEKAISEEATTQETAAKCGVERRHQSN